MNNETTLQAEIRKTKDKLSKKKIHENFGQKEVNAIREKFGHSSLIDDLEEWCMSWDGKPSSVNHKDSIFNDHSIEAESNQQVFPK